MRSVTIDRLRGLAVLLMILDHAIAVLAPPEWWPTRWLVTRFAMPLFALCAGAVGAGRWRSPTRWAWLSAAAVAGTWLNHALALPLPEMASVFLLLGVVAPAVGRWPVAVLLAGLVIAAQPLPWSNYNLGAVLALYAAGATLGNALRAKERPHLERALPAELELLGRWPLAWYVGHLAVLLALVKTREELVALLAGG